MSRIILNFRIDLPYSVVDFISGQLINLVWTMVLLISSVVFSIKIGE